MNEARSSKSVLRSNSSIVCQDLELQREHLNLPCWRILVKQVEHQDIWRCCCTWYQGAIRERVTQFPYRPWTGRPITCICYLEFSAFSIKANCLNEQRPLDRYRTDVFQGDAHREGGTLHVVVLVAAIKQSYVLSDVARFFLSHRISIKLLFSQFTDNHPCSPELPFALASFGPHCMKHAIRCCCQSSGVSPDSILTVHDIQHQDVFRVQRTKCA